jgi:formylglycine-generating enzyme
MQPPNMVWIPAGEFAMGSDDFYPEERPVRRVRVSGFWIDRCPVTNSEFRRFVEATGYVTVAERDLDPEPGSLVFRKTAGPVDLSDFRAWWVYVPAASWNRPEGPGSSVGGRERHPVVHVAPEDAEAYASWAGKELPTEAEWERAARGGLEGAVYSWGDEPRPRGRPPANTWQGEFPWQNTCEDGYEGTSPVGAFPANGYGLSDMTGNVWEWTADGYTDGATAAPCCAVRPEVAEIPLRVIKGGSHLCAPSYCLRYRPAARQPQAIDTSTSHIGFRCVLH